MLETYKSLLKEFVALKSVSTDPAFSTDINRTVEFLEGLFKTEGFEVTLLTSPRCNPVVVASYDAGKPSRTLVYGHYDVQPAAADQNWTSDPFVLREADGRLYARGVVDNKGQVLIHIVSVLEHIKAGTLATNVVFVIEGNEETSNPVLGELITANRELLACDVALISDGQIMGESPTLEASLRGGSNIRVQLRTGATDLHSGLAGGAVPSASKTLVDLLATLSDHRGAATIAGFYNGMKPIDPDVETANAAQAAGLTPKSYGVQQFLSANDTDPYSQTGLYPTLQISGISSGYTGGGFANIVPAKAEARLNLRTVYGQDSATVTRIVQNHLEKNVPSYAKLEIEVEGLHEPVSLDIEGGDAQHAAGLLKKFYGTAPIPQYVGGAIPVVSDFQRIFKLDALMINLGNDDCNMHGADENFRLDLIEKGLKFSQAWFGGETL